MLSHLAWTAVGVAALTLTAPAYAASHVTAAVPPPAVVTFRIVALLDGDVICFSKRPLPHVNREHADGVHVTERKIPFTCVPEDAERYSRDFTIGIPVIR
ncbi:hypothetical protein [Streptomyces sp. BE147]|uniref:hypothetical protein n=1 Tax=unclassified Streptomyces TaxID=2593676 RepID=UPI002E75DFC4|nr:hypothetical protein [Streptomyces sp. BE147]MEE1736161.1 hypothetical protein [Streptomyces sp. BE147]